MLEEILSSEARVPAWTSELAVGEEIGEAVKAPFEGHIDAINSSPLGELLFPHHKGV